jgi:hypothetical protein
MKNEEKTEYLTRDSIERLLSDDEIAAVSTAEAAARLANGEEYLDLEQLDRGVQRAGDGSGPAGPFLPRKAVHADTWSKVLKHLAKHAASHAS